MFIEKRSILASKTSLEFINIYISTIIKNECIICDMTKCSKCLFKLGAFRGFFKSYQKHIILFFYHNQSLSYAYPAGRVANMGRRKKKLLRIYDIHHKNHNHWDDSKDNTILITGSLHSLYHIRYDRAKLALPNAHKDFNKLLSENPCIK